MKRLLVLALVFSSASILEAQAMPRENSRATGPAVSGQHKEPTMLEPTLGICTAPTHSGAMPDGFSREAARAQFIDLLKKMGPLADFYHMLRENEGSESIIKAGKLLKHCHIAENKDRMAPGTGGEDFTPYFAALRTIGYRGGISIEGHWTNFDQDLSTALRTMPDQIAQVNQTTPLP